MWKSVTKTKQISTINLRIQTQQCYYKNAKTKHQTLKTILIYFVSWYNINREKNKYGGV